MITPAHPCFPYFRQKVEEIAKKKNVVDMGTPRSFHKEMSFFKHLFKGNYRSMAYIGNKDLDTDFEGDLMSLEMPDNSLDGIICLGVFPSVRDPHRAVSEIRRVLEPGGLFLGTFPFLTGYYAVTNGKDTYPDYWRFTHEGVKMLFSRFRHSELKPIDGGATVRYKFLFPIFNRYTRFELINRILARLDRRMGSPSTTSFILFAEK